MRKRWGFPIGDRCMRKIVVFLLMVSLSLLAQPMDEWTYGSGWTELTKADAATTVAMKQAAHAYNRPLLVYLSKPNSQCTDYCKPAWLNALCDGAFAHEENCVPTDATYGNESCHFESNKPEIVSVDEYGYVQAGVRQGDRRGAF